MKDTRLQKDTVTEVRWSAMRSLRLLKLQTSATRAYVGNLLMGCVLRTFSSRDSIPCRRLVSVSVEFTNLRELVLYP